jgi:hypothetical protein
MKRNQLLCGSVLAGVAAVFVPMRAAHAALYGNFVGPNLTYTNVTENDSELSGNPPVESIPAQGLFGPPILSPSTSDNLTFNDMSFAADAADGGLVYENGELTFGVVPSGPGKALTTLSFTEGGQWTLEGPAGDAVSFDSLVFDNLLITGVNGLPLATPIVVTPTFSETITPQSGPATTDTPGPGTVTITSDGGTGISVGSWGVTADFNLAAAVGVGNVTSVSVALDDALQASTTDVAGTVTLAQIDKKEFIVSGGTTPFQGPPPMPEPGTLSILAGGGLLLGRRRRASRSTTLKKIRKLRT